VHLAGPERFGADRRQVHLPSYGRSPVSSSARAKWWAPQLEKSPPMVAEPVDPQMPSVSFFLVVEVAGPAVARYHAGDLTAKGALSRL